ncbi:MAG: hypothetical protein K2J46_09915 [Muribaculaceae bacterium]|nr:hypothetical protein [Muribaculaceae bacterium]
MKKKAVIIKSRLMPKHYCMNLFGTFWARDTSWIDRDVINHERIHTAQMRELLFIPFYIVYVLEWLFRIIQYRDIHKAYLNISFEREAYTHGHDHTYLKNRKPYSFLKYLKSNLTPL